MEYMSLVLLHVFFGILWVGGAVTMGLFVLPSLLEAGPAAGPVMQGVIKRRFPVLMTVAGTVVVLSGLRMYMLRFDPAWVTTPEGIALSLGAVLGLGAMVIGLFVQKPTVERMGKLTAELAAAGGPPSPAQAAELAALRARLARVAKLGAYHLLGAALLMASHRLFAVM